MLQQQASMSSPRPAIRSTQPGKDFEILGEVAQSSTEEIAAAVRAARAALPAWRALGVRGRVEAIGRLAAALERRSEELNALTSREMGKPIQQSRSSTAWALRHLQWFLENAEHSLAPVVTFEDDKQIHRQVFEPCGVAAVIVPWNFPLSNFAMGAIQPLLAGNTVVYKVSEEVPLFGKLIDEVVADAKLPPGVFGQIYGAGEVGERLARSEVDLICFTGSSAVGQKLYGIAAERFIPCVLELGGSDAGIVFADADLEANLESIFWSKFINNGQICCGLKRLLVEQSVLEPVVERLRAHIASKKIGRPEEEDVTFGALVAARQVELLRAQVQDAIDKGAKAVSCLEIPAGLRGAYYPPTLLLGVTPAMRAWTEELFGPVLTVIPFTTEEEAIRIANDTPYGLSGYVFTRDKAKFERVAAAVETGAICLNGCDYSGPYNPFGGYKKSGLGRSGAALGFQQVSRVKAISSWK